MKLDGSRLIKIHLDKTQQTTVEHKVCNKYIKLTLCVKTVEVMLIN